MRRGTCRPRRSSWATRKVVERTIREDENDFPPSVDVEEVLQINKWFRKRRKYQDQEEYRFAWTLSSAQLNILPDFVDVELTKTGLSSFQPWTPPER